jgi:hypothetical protein
VHAHKRVYAADSSREGQQHTSGLQVRASCPVQGAHIADDSDRVVCTCMCMLVPAKHTKVASKRARSRWHRSNGWKWAGGGTHWLTSATCWRVNRVTSLCVRILQYLTLAHSHTVACAQSRVVLSGDCRARACRASKNKTRVENEFARSKVLSSGKMRSEWSNGPHTHSRNHAHTRGGKTLVKSGGLEALLQSY